MEEQGPFPLFAHRKCVSSGSSRAVVHDGGRLGPSLDLGRPE